MSSQWSFLPITPTHKDYVNHQVDMSECEGITMLTRAAMNDIHKVREGTRFPQSAILDFITAE